MFRTGDIGRFDEEKFLYVIDRVKDIIISGGENVFPAYVENALMQMPAVAACAVIPVPDPKWGEAVHVVVVLKPGEAAKAEDVIAYCRGLIARYKCPRSVEFREALPLSGAGKILKTALRDPHWVGRRRRIN